jgi:hypothetical protein
MKRFYPTERNSVNLFGLRARGVPSLMEFRKIPISLRQNESVKENEEKQKRNLGCASQGKMRGKRGGND